MKHEKNFAPPPKTEDFWDLFEFFWVRGLGNDLHADGTSQSWTALSLEIALDGTPDKRSIENWQSRTNMPSPDNLRKLSALIAGGDDALRKLWYEALIDARQNEKRREKVKDLQPQQSEEAIKKPPRKFLLSAISLSVATCIGAALLFWPKDQGPYVENMRICHAVYFDEETKKCTQHVDVFVHGVDEVFLSFDFNGVEHGTPFERWWIHNGERVAGRTSFNDEAWPGYTFWRPGVLQVGTYVVRLVVNGEVTTQTFYVQAEGFTSDS